MSIKVGVLLAAYNVESTIEEALKGWEGVDFTFKTVASAIPFKEYSELNVTEDNTINLLKSHKLISKVITEPKFIMEHEARTLALKELLKFNPEYIMLQDGDELPKTEELNRIVKYLGEVPAAWYRLNYRNFFGSGSHWVDGFNPPRIFRTRIGERKISRLYWDNDVSYCDPFSEISYKDLSCNEIPRETAHIKHLSWMTKTAQNKIRYQSAHFGASGCSYKINENTGEIELDYSFYIKNKMPLPIVYKESLI